MLRLDHGWSSSRKSSSRSSIIIIDEKFEVFTLPHIVWLDFTGLQVIFQSPPGVQVPFFLVGTQPNHDTNFTWSPDELTGQWTPGARYTVICMHKTH